MKPFNLELAKQGHPVCARDGRDVTILKYDFNHEPRKFTVDRPLICLFSDPNGYESIRLMPQSGEDKYTNRDSDDLFMKSKKEKRWIHISNSDLKNGEIAEAVLYDHHPGKNFCNWQLIEFEIEV